MGFFALKLSFSRFYLVLPGENSSKKFSFVRIFLFVSCLVFNKFCIFAVVNNQQ